MTSTASPGMVDLGGLDSLTNADKILFANNASLVDLGGAPQIVQVGKAQAAGNPKLDQASVDAWIAGLAPAVPCFEAVNTDLCGCLVVSE